MRESKYLRRTLKGLDEFEPSDYELQLIKEASQRDITKSLNRGLFHNRIKNNPKEAIFAEEWSKINEPEAGVNMGRGLLQYLFIEEDSLHNFNYLVEVNPQE